MTSNNPLGLIGHKTQPTNQNLRTKLEKEIVVIKINFQNYVKITFNFVKVKVHFFKFAIILKSLNCLIIVAYFSNQ